MNKRKHGRCVRALARYPKTFLGTRTGKRTEIEWREERNRLKLLIQTRGR